MLNALVIGRNLLIIVDIFRLQWRGQIRNEKKMTLTCWRSARIAWFRGVTTRGTRCKRLRTCTASSPLCPPRVRCWSFAVCWAGCWVRRLLAWFDSIFERRFKSLGNGSPKISREVKSISELISKAWKTRFNKTGWELWNAMDGMEMYTLGRRRFARRGEPACTDAAQSVGETSSRASRQCRSHFVGISANQISFFFFSAFLNLTSFFRVFKSIRDSGNFRRLVSTIDYFYL